MHRPHLVSALVAAGLLLPLVSCQEWLGAFGEAQTVVNEPQSSELKPVRILDCRGLVGTVDERLDTCIRTAKEGKHSPDLVDLVTRLATDAAVLRVGPFTLEGVEFQTFEDQPDSRASLLQTDEAAAAKQLRDAGIRTVVVARDLIGALDRDAVVLSRLAQHDHLEWFQLRHVSARHLVYWVRKDSMRVGLRGGNELLRGLRQRLEGVPPTPQQWRPHYFRAIASMRLQGNTLATRHVVHEGDIEGALDELANKLRREWERHAQPDGHGTLDDRLDDLRLEINVVMERARVEPHDPYFLFHFWELGVDGVMFAQRPGVEPEKFTYYPGSEAVTRSIRSPDAFLRAAVREGGWIDARPWQQDPRTRLDVFRGAHFMESKVGGGPAVRLTRAVPEVSVDDITDAAVQEMLAQGGEWWLHNLQDDGSFAYKYWPTQNRQSTEYNEVRHILGARDLADAWRYRHDDRYLQGSRASMDWLLKYQVHDTDPVDARLPHPPTGSMLFRYPAFDEAELLDKAANQKTGTVAVALLGWISWANATGSHEEDERIRKMAAFTLAMLTEDGRFEPYFVNTQHSYYQSKNDITPGEAALALGQVAEYFGEPEWLDFYPKFLAYYRPWFRERAQRKRPDGRWPHDTYVNEDRLDLVQFGPWSVMAANQAYKLTKDPEIAEFGLEVADWMIDNYQWTGERSPWPDYVGGYYKMDSELPAMQTFCYSEGTTAAYALATQYAPDRKHKYLQSTREAIRFLQVMQYDPDDSYFVADPLRVQGGIKYAMNENKIRIDYVGHGLSTLSQYLDARAADTEGPTFSIRDPEAYAAMPLAGRPVERSPEDPSATP